MERVGGGDRERWNAPRPADLERLQVAGARSIAVHAGDTTEVTHHVQALRPCVGVARRCSAGWQLAEVHACGPCSRPLASLKRGWRPMASARGPAQIRSTPAKGRTATPAPDPYHGEKTRERQWLLGLCMPGGRMRSRSCLQVCAPLALTVRAARHGVPGRSAPRCCDCRSAWWRRRGLRAGGDVEW